MPLEDIAISAVGEGIGGEGDLDAGDFLVASLLEGLRLLINLSLTTVK